MKYTVIWAKQAEAQLASDWLSSTGDARAAITQACRILDTSLKNTPDALGESRLGNLRIAIERPLTILFRISPDDRVVTVLDVRLHPTAR